MASDDVERIRRAYEAFLVRDVSSVADVLADDVVYYPPAGDAFLGREQVTAVLESLPALWAEYEAEAEEFRDVGEHVVVLGRYRCTARETGKRFDAPFALVCTMRDGKVSSVREFTATAQLVDALGLAG